jgi:tetratricopeptide (TPR) repeat protein
MADIFVSYTSSDSDWARWIGEELGQLGHTPRIHEWEIEKGEDILAWMEQRLETADYALCVMSDAYLKAPYSVMERNAATWRAAGKRPGSVLFVVVKPCTVPALIAPFRRCELFGLDEPAKRARFREFMGERKAAETPKGERKTALSNVPIRVPSHFLGRDEALAEIEKALARYRGRVAVTALHGLRGVGKTTLAATYADRHRCDYRVTWWIRAQTELTIRADLVALGVRLNWTAPDAEEKPALAAVMERLQDEGDGVLLIFDNAVDAKWLKPYLPRTGSAHVLVTSNTHAWRGIADLVEIRLWPQEIGAQYLIERTGRECEREGALHLSNALGGLPLALEQAAAYCERLNISLADYRARFAAAPAKYLDDSRDAPSEYHDGLTVAKTFALGIEEAGKLHSAAEPLIVHVALLAPEPIPLFLFSEARDKFGEELACAVADDGLDEAVAALLTFGLLDRETITDERDPTIRTDCIRLHRLVRQVAVLRFAPCTRERAETALLEAVAATYPRRVWGETKAWPRARRLDAIALALVDDTTHCGRNGELAAILLDHLGTYRHSALAMYDAAQALYEKALTIRERVLGADHPATAESINMLGVLLHERGDFARAEVLYKRALSIREKALGPKHCDTATTLNNYAMLLYERGCLDEARELCDRALTIRLEVLGSENAATATSLHNLGTIFQEQRDLEGARSYFDRALEIRQRTLGAEDPFTARTLSALGILLSQIGNTDAARPLCERAKIIWEKFFEGCHPATAAALEGLAHVFEAERNLVEALNLLARAVAIQKTLRPDHPRTYVAVSKLARLRLTAGDPNEALALSEAALAAQVKMFGCDHGWVKSSAQTVAEALDALGRADEATGVRSRFGIEETRFTYIRKTSRASRRRAASRLAPLSPLSQSSPDHAAATRVQ